MAFLKSFRESLAKTRSAVFGALGDFVGVSRIDDNLFDQIEEQLILADAGGTVAVTLTERVRAKSLRDHFEKGSQVMAALEEEIAKLLTAEKPFDVSGKPAVILVIGVNGVGKTTSIGKLANHYKGQGRKVLLAAADTFRAAAVEQLRRWSQRAGVPMLDHGEGADPASVVYDAVAMATAQGYDMVICDTAGRLHNKKNLMEELSKIARSVRKASPEASIETLLVLDAVTGQNAITQAQSFIDAAGATGIVLTKLDGTAKGGSVLAIKEKLGLPVRFAGVGEQMEDLLVFDPKAFAKALFEGGEVTP